MKVEFVRNGEAGCGTCTLRVNVDDRPATVGQVMRLLATPSFSKRFAKSILQGRDHARAYDSRGVFFECVPVSSDTVEEMPFECAIITTPQFDYCLENPKPFKDYLKKGSAVAVFQNRRHDATLICPIHRDGDRGPFGHLTEFLDNASAHQHQVFWARVGETYLEIVRGRGSYPTYLSTSGTGVAYLHMRIDRTPKYFHYTPYMP